MAKNPVLKTAALFIAAHAAIFPGFARAGENKAIHSRAAPALTGKTTNSLSGTIEFGLLNIAENWRKINRPQYLLTNADIVFRLPNQSINAPAFEIAIEADTNGYLKFGRFASSKLAITGGPQFIVKDFGPVQWISPYLEYDWARAGNYSLYQSYGIGTGFGGYFGADNNASWAIDTDILYRAYQNSVIAPFATENSGPNYYLKGEISLPMATNLDFNLEVQFERQWAKYRENSFIEVTSSTQLVHSFKTPINRTAWSSLSISGNIKLRRYDQPSPFIDPTRREEDLDLNLSAKLSLAIAGPLSATFEVSQRWGRSSIVGYGSNDTSIQTGITLRF